MGQTDELNYLLNHEYQPPSETNSSNKFSGKKIHFENYQKPDIQPNFFNSQQPSQGYLNNNNNNDNNYNNRNNNFNLKVQVVNNTTHSNKRMSIDGHFKKKHVEVKDHIWDKLDPQAPIQDDD